MRTWLYILWACFVLLVTALTCVATIALAFPENVRLGYAGCNACHVSPTGGGALTTYGRSTAEELSTFGLSGSGQLLGFVPQPEWLGIGGDTRHVNINGEGFHRKFWMQADFELALKLSPEVWAAGAIGAYGEDRRVESRRSYLLWSPGKYVSVRLGRFFPAYGLMIPDHTAATRNGLGFREGLETYNAELRLHSALAELFVTGLFGKDAEVAAREDGLHGRARDSGVAARLTAFVKRTVQLGANYRYLADTERAEHAAGAFLNLGILRDLYLLAEVDRKATFRKPEEPKLPHQDVAWVEIGYEVYRGVHLQGTYEFERSNRWGYGLVWFPLPHTEITARTKQQDAVWTTVVMTHFYF